MYVVHLSACRLSVATSTPSTRTAPAAAGARRSTARSSELLPAPVRPTTARCSLGWHASVSPRSALEPLRLLREWYVQVYI